MATISAMQVAWVDPTRRETSTFIHLTPTEVENKTIYSLKLLIAKKLKLSSPAEVDLKFYGECLTHGALDAYLPHLRLPFPRFSAKLTAGVTPISFFVKSLSGRTNRLNVDRRETIGYLKRLVEDLDGSPSDVTCLVYSGHALADLDCIGDCIPPNATVFTHCRLRGGSVSCGGGKTQQSFVDVSNENAMEVVEFSPDAPEWCRVTRGLNVTGRCTNRNCQAYSRYVYIPIGFRAFNLHAHTSKCPMCEHRVIPTSCGFYLCQWRFEGMKTKTDLHMCSGWKLADGRVYHEFLSDEGNIVLWDSLIIIAQEIKSKGECAVCFEPFGKNNLATTKCHHRLHKKCLEEWKTACTIRKSFPSCPFCREPLI